MSLLTPDVESFLGVLLPQYHLIQQAVAGLGTRSTSTENLAAVQQLFPVLCESLRAFERVSLPELDLLPVPDDQQVIVDVADLSALAGLFDQMLHSAGDPRLVWPPPGRNPPAIVADLKALYEQATPRNSRGGRAPATGAQLARMVEATRDRACSLAEVARNQPGTAPPRTDGRRIAKKAALTLAGGAISVLATTSGVLQVPGAINSFGNDSRKLAQTVHHVAELARGTLERTLKGLEQDLTQEMQRVQGLGQGRGDGYNDMTF